MIINIHKVTHSWNTSYQGPKKISHFSQKARMHKRSPNFFLCKPFKYSCKPFNISLKKLVCTSDHPTFFQQLCRKWYFDICEKRDTFFVRFAKKWYYPAVRIKYQITFSIENDDRQISKRPHSVGRTSLRRFLECVGDWKVMLRILFKLEVC